VEKGKKMVPSQNKIANLQLLPIQTDGARDMFEKATGKDIPDKFSN
jgi:hypothetical protein